MKKFKYFTTGEFARLHNINKRTLHYYDEIDLIKPSEVGENGYRYYSYYQSVELELILVMRRLGLSIDEIMEYKQDRSVDKLKDLFLEQIDLLDKNITKLTNTKSYIEGKLDQLDLLNKIEDGKIEIVELNEEKLLVSEDFKDDSNEEYFRLMRSFNTKVKREKGITGKFGCRISVENLYNDKLLSYDRFFMSVKKDKDTISADGVNFDVKPKGRYIRVYTKGNWYRIMDIYHEILKYAKQNKLELEGYGYEVGVNELNCFTIDEYITEITVKIKD